jgi:D-3-phosphoglycerate dehydrogenase / 2-oxoglutarate reductase
MSDKPLSYPKEKIHVLLLEGIHHNAVEHLEQAGYTNVERLDRALTGADLLDAVGRAHVIGVRSRTQLTAEVLGQARRLLAVGCFCIGTNQVDLGAAAGLGVPVFNAPHSNTRSVAELVIAEAVMLLRGLGDKNTEAHQGRWRKSAKDSYELRGKTLGIVGYGHIGSQVSILAESMGMRVLYQDIEPKLPMGNAQQLKSLDELLPRVDVLTLHVPQDASTRDLITAAELQRMRPGSYLINASRGTVVEIDALAAALESGHLLGAAIDVFPTEPKSTADPFVSPLQGLPNVILTPHIGGSTQEAQENIGVEVASKLVNFSDLGSTIGAVNFPNISLTPNPGPTHRLLHVHKNQPGVMGGINRILADEDANVLGQHLQTTPAVGYVVIDIEQGHSPDLRQRLEEVPGTIRCRILY